MKYKVGDKIVSTDGWMNGCDPKCYPPKGTKGVITEVSGEQLRVQWDKSSTSGDGTHCYNTYHCELYVPWCKRIFSKKTKEA